MCEDNNEFSTYPDGQEEYAPAPPRLRYNRLADRHGCNPETPQHKQAPIVIKGAYTTVDHKLHDLVSILNRLGWTTRYSCQGSKKKPAYIMFEGSVAHIALIREMTRLDEDDFFAGLESDARDTADDMISRWIHAAHEELVYYGSQVMPKKTLMPAINGSEWIVQTQRQDGRIVDAKHTIRFPKSDIKTFTTVVRQLENALLRESIRK